MGQTVLGWVYVLTNVSFKENMIKIGFTNKPTPQERAQELSKHTGVPTEFEVVYAVKVADAHMVETRVHHLLQHKRARQNREFFECTVAEAVQTIKSVVGRAAVSEIDNRGRKANKNKQPEPVAMPKKSSSSKHHHAPVAHHQSGSAGKGLWVIVVLVLLGVAVWWGYGSGALKQEAAVAQGERTAVASANESALANSSSLSLQWQDSRQALQLAWDKIDDGIQHNLRDEQQQWERHKTKQCQKEGKSAGESARLACEIKLNTERAQYLRGFSIR